MELMLKHVLDDGRVDGGFAELAAGVPELPIRVHYILMFIYLLESETDAHCILKCPHIRTIRRMIESL